MKRFVIAISPVIIALLIFAGCSDDDDCATCPDGSMLQKAVMTGDFDVDDDYLGFWGMITGVSGTVPDIDSVLVDGHAAQMYSGYGEGGVGISVRYYEGDYDKTPTAYSSGDIIHFEIFTPYGLCECREKVLDYDDDRPVLIGWQTDWPYTTVAVGTEITVDWHSVVNADWYAVSWEYEYEVGGVYQQERSYFFAEDTTFTIPAAEVDRDGRFYVRIRPVAGPLPTEGGNVTGEVVKGTISSSSYDSFSIYVGTGQYKMAPDGPEDVEPEVSLQEFLSRLNAN